MVQITPEEVEEMRKGRKRLEEMSQFDRDICGADQAKHLIIPMADVYNLRRIAGLMHGLASDLDVLSRRQDYTARTIILETRAAIDGCNRRIKEFTGKGKRRKPWDDHSN